MHKTKYSNNKKVLGYSVAIREIVLADSWFDNLTAKQQQEYIEQHPNSKYAKNYRKKGNGPTNPSGSRKVVKDKQPKHEHVEVTPVHKKFHKEISTLDKSDREFFKTGQDKPKSSVRTTLAKHIRTSHREIAHQIKHQVTEWKDGCKAIGKLASGKKISEHEKKALKALVIDAAVTAASVAVTGGFAHGAALAVKHTAFDVLKDVVLKSTLKSTAHAMGTSGVLTGGLAVLQAIASSTSKGRSAEDKILETLIKKLADYIEKGDIPDDVWQKTIEDLNKKSKKRK